MMAVSGVFVVGVLVVGGVGALVVWAVVVGARRERERLGALEAWTAAHGWQVQVGNVATSWRHRMRGLSQFRVRMVLSGQAHGIWVSLADCSYTTKSTSRNSNGVTTTTTTTHYLIVLVAHMPGAWPQFHVKRQGVGAWIGRLVGQTPTKTGHPEFDRRFGVYTQDPQGTLSLFTPELIQAHLAGYIGEWGLYGNDLLIRTSGSLRAEAMDDLIGIITWLAGRLGNRV